MKKVLLKVYTAKNLGDDLFIKMILDRYDSKAKFYLEASNEYNEIFSSSENLEIFNYQKKAFFFNKVFNLILRNVYSKLYQVKIIDNIVSRYETYIEKCDFFVCLGGSVFMQYKKIPYYSDVEFYNYLQTKYPNKSTFFIGGNFGPFNDSTYFDHYHKIFSNATDVSFREESSFNLFKDINKVRFTSDIVFGLKYKKKEKIKHSVGFSVVGPVKYVREFNVQAYILKYVELINSYRREHYIIRLFSFAEKEGDLEVINKIFEKLEDKQGIEIINYEGNIDSFIDRYQEMETVFCGRFHSMILSMLFDQKIFPIIYSKKMTNVLKDIEYKGNTIDLFCFHEINIDDIRSQINYNSYDISTQIINSEKHFTELDKVLL